MQATEASASFLGNVFPVLASVAEDSETGHDLPTIESLCLTNTELPLEQRDYSSFYCCFEAARQLRLSKTAGKQTTLPQPCCCATNCPCRQPPVNTQRIAHVVNYVVNQAQLKLMQTVMGVAQQEQARHAAHLRSYLLTCLDVNQEILLLLVAQGNDADLSELMPSGSRWNDVAPPRRGRMHPLSMPDIIPLLSHLSYVSDSVWKNKLPLLHTLSKLLPSRCLFRGFADGLLREFEETPNTVDFVRQCICAALAGTLWTPSRMTVAPMFAHIVEIDLLFNQCTVEQMQMLVKQAPRVVFQSLKEALCFYIRVDAPLREALCSVYNGWVEFENDVHLVGESVRAAFGSFADGDWKITLANCEERLHRQSGGAVYVKKLQKRSFMTAWLSQCDRVLVARSFSPSQQRAVGLPVLNTIAKIIASLNTYQTWNAQANLLYATGIPADDVHTLCRLATDFGRGDVSSNSLGIALNKLPSETLTLAAMVYGMMEDASVVESVPVTADLERKQRHALYCRLGYPKNKPLPPTAGQVYVCRQCGKEGRKWKCPEERTDELYGIGPHDVFHTTDNVICCNRKSHAGFCGGSALSTMSLLGKWVLFYGRWYTLCPLCAAPCRFDMRRTMQPCGFSCGRCVPEGERLRATNRRGAGAGAGLAAPWPRDVDPRAHTTACANCAQKRTLSDDTWPEMFVGNDQDPTIAERIVLCLSCAFAKDSKWGVCAKDLGTTRSGLLVHIRRSKRRF